MFEIDEVATFEYRLVIEMAAAALAAERHSEQALERMTRRLDELVEAKTALAFERADLNFREALGVASGNRHLLDAISRLGSLPTQSTDDREVHLIECRAIYDAVESGDSEFARAAVHQHLIHRRKRMESRYSV